MKKVILPILSLLCVAACSDDMSQIGTSVGNSTIEITEDSLFTITATPVEASRNYNNGTALFLGNIEIPNFGSISSEFMAQLVPSVRLDTTNVESIDSLVLNLRFSKTGGFVGDSLAPMQLNVYQMQKRLDRDDVYTDIDPEPFYMKDGKSILLGTKSYTATEFHLPDSVKNDYFKQINVTLPLELAQQFYDDFKRNPSIFESPSNFANYFPGIYITNTYGSGLLLNFKETTFSMYYTKNKFVTSESTTDSIYQTVDPDFMAVNALGYSVNHITTTTPEEFTLPNDEYCYVKAPCALDAKIDFPVQKIIDRIKEGATSDTQILNAVTFSIPATAPEVTAYKLTPPPYLLFLRESDKEAFFKNNELPDSKNYFYAVYYNGSYNFGNISSYITNIMENNKGGNATPEDEAMLLVPVAITTEATTTSSAAVKSVSPYFSPALVKLHPQDARIKVIYTTRTKL